MNIAFKNPADNGILVPTFATQKLVVISTGAADTRSLVVNGLSGSPVTLSGTEPTQTSVNLASLSSVSLNSISLTDTVRLYLQGSSIAKGYVVLAYNPGTGEQLTVGPASSPTTFQFTNTATTSTDIQIGANAWDTATNAVAAINSFFAGSHVVLGTPIGTDSNTIPVSDVLAYARSAPLVLSTTSGSSVFCLPMSPGSTGALVATIPPGQRYLHQSISVSDISLATENLAAGMVWTSDWVTVNGSRTSLFLTASGVETAIDVRYELRAAAGGIIYAGSVTGELAVSAGIQNLVLNVPESASQLRLIIDNSASATSAAVYAAGSRSGS